jgi:hypothetical protein
MNRNLKAAMVVGNPKPAICPMVGNYLIDKTYAEDPRLDTWVARAQKLIPHAEGQP